MKTVKGDVLKVNHGIIVHGCNCGGAFGAGIAKQIKETYPQVYKEYRDDAYAHGLRLGAIIPVMVDTDKYIVNAMTQQSTGYGKQVSYDAIERCFEHLLWWINHHHLSHLPVCFPMIGAGLGGGNWKIISTIIDETLPEEIERICYVL